MSDATAAGGGGEVCLHGSPHRLQCAPGQTLLAAALAAGLDYPYECASGSCGSCRTRLLEGRVALCWPEAPGLGERDRARGDRILACQSVPQGNCRIQVRLGTGDACPPPRRLQARVRSLQPLNEDVLHVVLAPEDGAATDFRPGQFMRVDWGADTGWRAYSMCNLPRTGTLEFMVKRKPGGAGSARLFGGLRAGDRLALEGPYGRAWLREPLRADEPLVLLAGGSGLAPMWAIAQAALATQPARAVRLYFGVQRPRDLFWAAEMQALAATEPRFVPVIAVAEGDPPPGSRRGAVGEVLAADLPPVVDHGLYMAGPPGLVDHVNAQLVASGRLRADRVFYDRFA